MRLALIPPIDLLEWTDTTDMQLMLPHLLDDPRYEYTYSHHCKDPDQYVILDNGEAEGLTTNPWHLMAIADRYKVDEVVAPDTIADMDATCLKLSLFMINIEKAYDDGVPPWNIMFVAQGKTFDQVKESIKFATRYEAVTTIGLPRHLPETLRAPAARKNLADWFDVWQRGRVFKPMSIHLLGGSPEHPTELRNYKWPALVRSTDTSAPFNFAYEQKTLRVGNVVRRPEGYFYLPAEMFLAPKKSTGGTYRAPKGQTYLEGNIRNLMEWTGNGE